MGEGDQVSAFDAKAFANEIASKFETELETLTHIRSEGPKFIDGKQDNFVGLLLQLKTGQQFVVTIEQIS